MTHGMDKPSSAARALSWLVPLFDGLLIGLVLGKLWHVFFA